MQEIISCGEQCPFCGAPCDVHSGGKTRGCHSASQHRPVGIMGYKRRFRKHLFTESCEALVQSKDTFKHSYFSSSSYDFKTGYKPFRKYQKYYPDWYIEPNADPDVENCWKWILMEYNEEFADHYETKIAKIPAKWKGLTKEDIMRETMEKHFAEPESPKDHNRYYYGDNETDDNDSLSNFD